MQKYILGSARKQGCRIKLHVNLIVNETAKRTYTGVPNDCFEDNRLYVVLNICEVSLRESCLIFNFPGKKIPALHCQRGGLLTYKTPSQLPILRFVNEPARLKISPQEGTSQRRENFPVCQQVVVYTICLPASEGLI